MRTQTQAFSRRQLLAAFSSLAVLGLARPARAAVTDYKALVAINLAGGNDGNNTIVPLDATHQAAYNAIRGAGGLALSIAGGTLLAQRTATTRAVDTPVDQPFAFHYGLPEVDNLYGQGKVAVILNCGNLRQPLTKTQLQAGTGVPPQLYSHPDQNLQAQAGTPAGSATGWGGRLVDLLGTGGILDSLAVASNGLFIHGELRPGNVIPVQGTMELPGMNVWPQAAADARRAGLVSILKADSGNLLANTANKAVLDAMDLAAALRQARSGTPLATAFPGTSIGQQLKLIAQLIANRSKQGPGRQVYLATLGGFDTHSGQAWQHWSLLSQLSAALGAFQAAMVEAGADQKVTSFTLSEFGRDFQPNSGGTDHAWGSNHLVLGGAVRGGLYGRFPQFTLGGPDDANGRGAWIPQIGMQQVGATLGRWFGADAATLAGQVFRNELATFSRPDLGFMG